MNKLLRLVCLFGFYSTVVSLQCFTCYSSDSWDDCHRRMSIVTCGSRQDRCIKVQRTMLAANNERFTVLSKSCFHHTSCTLEACMNHSNRWKDAECSFECCNTTLCNVGSTKHVSRITQPVTSWPVTQQVERATSKSVMFFIGNTEIFISFTVLMVMHLCE
ncbi:uncharacterized protein LOC116609837 [Nematostella vectensis]|uniref:uncharacterized protein LOC116609837 n=1 Tax=Nematostella vectensis TaxID=45351 RepID=UPI0013905233|nr:uncharacterized protein LOC116609837 [Nematostella vectensis]